MSAGRRFLAEVMPDNVKKTEKVQRDFDRLYGGMKQVISGINALQDHVSNGGDLPYQYGTAQFFNDSIPGLQKKIAEFAKAYADASSIINQ
jgi:hypothetical protein